jgi:hypothetical protein
MNGLRENGLIALQHGVVGHPSSLVTLFRENVHFENSIISASKWLLSTENEELMLKPTTPRFGSIPTITGGFRSLSSLRLLTHNAKSDPRYILRPLSNLAFSATNAIFKRTKR